MREILQLQKVSEYAAINMIQNPKHNEQEELQQVCRVVSHSSAQPSAHQCSPRLSTLCIASVFCALSCSYRKKPLQLSYCHLRSKYQISLSFNWSVLYAVFDFINCFLSCGLEFHKTNKNLTFDLGLT